MQESVSFWTDIKNLEEQIASSPDSFCFARLADVYLKVGLVDDALNVARQGVTKYPRFLSGQRVLALACHAKGLHEEAMAALHLVTDALPEDIASQKLLGRLLVDAGLYDAACQAFRTALEFAPDDVECRIELESLKRSARNTIAPFDPNEDDEEVIEDLEILEELDILEEDQLEPESLPIEVSSGQGSLSVAHHDPLTTATLAELYVSQGFIHKALEIYRAILSDNPADRVTAERVSELEGQVTCQTAGSVPEVDETFDDETETETETDVTFGQSVDAFFEETGSAVLSAPVDIPVPESQQACAGNLLGTSDAFAVPEKGSADNALSVFDGWLENIRRIKSCR